MSGERKPESFFVHTFGCQMNQADSGVISALLRQDGFVDAASESEAEVILFNTCAVRENAVDRIANRLRHLQARKRRDPAFIVGVAGCIPQYRREALFEEYPVIDFLAGPDTYRSLSQLIRNVRAGRKQVALDFDPAETYTGIDPEQDGGYTAFLPVMRGCNNMCAYCVVPFTRGRERSHSRDQILEQAGKLAESGCREITLLGQNVDSYFDEATGSDFADLLDAVSRKASCTRIRFTTSHPKDISEKLIRTMVSLPNICHHIHLPVQSGSSRVLAGMNRGYSAEQYRQTVSMIREFMPRVALSTDLIAGFCGEREEDHQATLSLLADIRFESAFMFCYSERPGTLAAKTLQDDVPEAVKKRRLQEIIELQNTISAECYQASVGTVATVLAESRSKRSEQQLMGRTSENRAVVFDRASFAPGDLVQVRITAASSATLIGEPVGP